MATEPTKLPEWASSGSAAITEPSEAKKDLGWIAEKPPHEYFNWLLNLIYQWVEFFKLIGVPIGSVLFWHKSLTGVPSLSGQWVECNGQTLSDVESPLDGQVIPDINGDARFIRGAATSGTTQANQNKSHTHTSPVTGTGSVDVKIKNALVGVWARILGGDAKTHAAGSQFTDISGSAGATDLEVLATDIASALTVTLGTSGGTESRPDNIGMVAIMRVK